MFFLWITRLAFRSRPTYEPGLVGPGVFWSLLRSMSEKGKKAPSLGAYRDWEFRVGVYRIWLDYVISPQTKWIYVRENESSVNLYPRSLLSNEFPVLYFASCWPFRWFVVHVSLYTGDLSCVKMPLSHSSEKEMLEWARKNRSSTKLI